MRAPHGLRRVLLESFVRDLNAGLTGRLEVEALRVRREQLLRKELQAQVNAAGGAATEARVASWAERLRGTPDGVLYPRPGRPADTRFAGLRRALPLGPQQSAAIDEACRSLGVNSFTFFSAVFAAVVARHTGSSRALLGTPVLSRRTLGSYELCGLFLNTLPLIVDVDWELPFDVYATQAVARETAEVKRDAHVPWLKIVRELRPDRSSSRNAIFSCMIAMQDTTAVDAGAPVRSVREHGNGTAKVDLWLGVTPTPHGWLLELEHDQRLLPAPIVDGIQDSLLGAVAQAAREPRTVLRELFHDASAAQSVQTDGYWRQPPTDTLSGWLEQAVRSYGSATAVDDGDTRLDYAALEAQVGQAASGLRALDVSAGDVVGLTTDQLVETIVAMLAVVRVGAAYLPLDLSLPADRLAYMATKADCRLVIGGGAVTGARVVPLAELAELAELSAIDPDPPGPGAGTAEQPIYVMFTSGSTGAPKGVLMGDGPLLNLTAWQVAALGLGPDTRFLQYAPLGFDVSFQEIIPTLVAGGTVVSRGLADRRDLASVVRRVEDAAVTHLYLPVAALRAFAGSAAEAGVGFDRVRVVCVSGEQLILDSQTRAFFAARPHLRLVNLYGPTETHAVTTHVLSGTGDWPTHVPIGHPITGTSAQVVDRTGHLAPPGVVGELLLGGRCPAEGYVNDPEQTATRFVPDPYGDGPRPVRYRTGDQVLWDETGTLVFLGRNDDQIKIRGYRVELGEIESSALELLPVRHAVAAVRGDAAGRHILLFVVPGNGAEPVESDAARRALSAALPSYMVPGAVLTVAGIPKTVNGKVDRAQLLTDADRLIGAQHGVAASGAEPVSDPTLRWLEQLWGQHLGREQIDPDASLLDLGAHSLMALAVVATIELERGVRVPLLDFFRSPTLRFLAGAIGGAQ
ncbi:non-ribosomal peptide synthetase [Dactylosporangium cerinum]